MNKPKILVLKKHRKSKKRRKFIKDFEAVFYKDYKTLNKDLMSELQIKNDEGFIW